LQQQDLQDGLGGDLGAGLGLEQVAGEVEDVGDLRAQQDQ